MNKKRISETNPQGVQYPEAVTADGTMVYAIDLDKNDCEGIHYYFLGCEGDEEEEMLFIQRKKGNGFTKFFRHKQGYIGDRDEPDRYLHNYAELRIKQRFDNSLQNNEFPVQFYVLEKCPENATCKLKEKLKCKGNPRPVLKTLNLRKFYDTCCIEKGADKYIADLLLTNSKDESVKPLLLEVFVTHKCTDEKIASGFPIIEIKINNKDDADNPIVENAGEIVDRYLFMKSENETALPPVVFYGFNRDVPFNDYVQCGNFTLIKNENELVAECKAIACNEVDKIISENGVFSLSAPIDELEEIDIYEMGMAKAQDMGFKVRDCSLCGLYKIPTSQKNRIDGRSCRLINVTWNYKDNGGQDKTIQNPYVCWMPYRCNGFDKSKQAAGCRKYYIDRQRISNLVRSLEKMNKILWMDESLLPLKPKPVEKPQSSNPYTQGRKLLTPQECFSCPIYRPRCGHCLGDEMKDGRRFVVCDYQRPK